MPALSVDAQVTHEAVTRADIFKMVLRSADLGDYGTATANGTTSTLIDTTNLQNLQLPGDQYANNWIRFVTGNLAGVTAAILGSPNFTTGTATITPTQASAPGSGATYELHRFLPPRLMIDELNDLLKYECWLMDSTILTEIPDGDMENSATTYWSTGATATVAKEANSVASIQMAGNQYLKVTAGGANQYARSSLMNVVPGHRYHASVLTRAYSASSVATCQMIIYDETNGVALETEEWANLVPVRLWQEFTIPAGCRQVSMRLNIVENARVGIFDEACFFDMNASDIALPWWVKDIDQVLSVNSLWARQPIYGQPQAWDGWYTGEENQRFDPKDVTFGRGQLRMAARSGGIGNPLWMWGKRNASAFSDDTTTQHLDVPWVVANLKLRMMKLAMNKAAVDDREYFASRLNEAMEEVKIQQRKQGKGKNDLNRNSEQMWVPAMSTRAGQGTRSSSISPYD